MTDVERTLLEQMENKNFQNVVSDDFAFADSLIDQKDLDKFLNDKEINNDGSND